MCGIAGSIGRNLAEIVVVNRLKRLEHAEHLTSAARCMASEAHEIEASVASA
jgi:hypothetical protein